MNPRLQGALMGVAAAWLAMFLCGLMVGGGLWFSAGVATLAIVVGSPFAMVIYYMG